MNKRFTRFLVVLSSLMVLAGCASSKPPPSRFVKGSGGLRISALIHAKGADFDFPHVSHNQGTLTLRYVSPMVAYLSDHASRRLEMVPLEEFISTWKEGKFTFPDEVTNAGFFAFEDVKHELADLSFSLNNPRYNESSQTLSFEIENWQGKENIHVKHLDDVTIYIDGIWKRPVKGVKP